MGGKWSIQLEEAVYEAVLDAGPHGLSVREIAWQLKRSEEIIRKICRAETTAPFSGEIFRLPECRPMRFAAIKYKEEASVLSDKQILDKLTKCVEANRSLSMGIVYKPGDVPGEPWSLMTTFGQEAPDSPMAAGSHIGTGPSLRAALSEAFGES